MKQKMQPKDLITVGVFSAIMFVVCMGIAMLGYIPIFIPLLSVLVPLIGGIPFMLFLTKARKFGMVLIMSVLIGLVVSLMGMGVWVIATAPAAAEDYDSVIRDVSLFPYSSGRIWRNRGCHAYERDPLWRRKTCKNAGIPYGAADDFLREDRG